MAENAVFDDSKRKGNASYYPSKYPMMPPMMMPTMLLQAISVLFVLFPSRVESHPTYGAVHEEKGEDAVKRCLTFVFDMMLCCHYDDYCRQYSSMHQHVKRRSINGKIIIIDRYIQ